MLDKCEGNKIIDATLPYVKIASSTDLAYRKSGSFVSIYI